MDQPMDQNPLGNHGIYHGQPRNNPRTPAMDRPIAKFVDTLWIKNPWGTPRLTTHGVRHGLPHGLTHAWSLPWFHHGTTPRHAPRFELGLGLQ